MEFRHNAMCIRSIESFLKIHGSVSNGKKDVYFVRSIGEIPNMSAYVKRLDAQMQNCTQVTGPEYVRISTLPVPDAPASLQCYTEAYENIQKSRPIRFQNIVPVPGFQEAVRNACAKIGSIYQDSKDHVSPSMVKNLLVKLLFWLDHVMAKPMCKWNEKMCIKVLADNITKAHEYLFYLFLTFLGCDVLLIENRGDISSAKELLRYSDSFVLGPCGTAVLTEYIPEQAKKSALPSPSNAGRGAPRCTITVPENPRHPRDVHRSPSASPAQAADKPVASRREKTFEELARLASSIVLIAIHDKDGDVIGSGSGIMIGTDGYILTNNHVASAGCYFSVRIEEDEEVYATREVIKYNSATDLAIIRINRRLTPLKVYNGKEKLVRGQRVIAIGSPLGLFNSVSDGIISGFRNIRDVEMIQFTAPISHGSSGGAVLNMYGEVIGISTAGIDSGQNINLAIGYENINFFARGFMV